MLYIFNYSFIPGLFLLTVVFLLALSNGCFTYNPRWHRWQAEPEVCGSDGITYRSLKDFKRAAKCNELLEFLYYGPCAKNKYYKYQQTSAPSHWHAENGKRPIYIQPLVRPSKHHHLYPNRYPADVPSWVSWNNKAPHLSQPSYQQTVKPNYPSSLEGNSDDLEEEPTNSPFEEPQNPKLPQPDKEPNLNVNNDAANENAAHVGGRRFNRN